MSLCVQLYSALSPILSGDTCNLAHATDLSLHLQMRNLTKLLRLGLKGELTSKLHGV
jgi:hypothetical protein